MTTSVQNLRFFFLSFLFFNLHLFSFSIYLSIYLPIYQSIYHALSLKEQVYVTENRNIHHITSQSTNAKKHNQKTSTSSLVDSHVTGERKNNMFVSEFSDVVTNLSLWDRDMCLLCLFSLFPFILQHHSSPYPTFAVLSLSHPLAYL